MKRIAICLPLVALMLSLSSCGGGGESSSSDSSGKKIVHIPMRSDGPRSLDPVRGSTTYDNTISCNIYETLVEYNYLKRPTDARNLQPLLLAKMPEISEDGRTYHFTLRDDVKFHDDDCFAGGKGRKLKAADVIYSWKRMADNDNEPKSWWLMANTIVGFDEYRDQQNAADEFDYDVEVSGMRVINDLEFEIELIEPVYRFMYILAMFQTAVVPREAVETYGSKFNVHPVGTGPFTLAEDDYEAGKRIVLKKNPNYREVYYPEIPEEDYEGKERDIELGFYKDAGKRLPIVDEVEFTVYQKDPPMWLKFKSEELDYSQVPAENFKEAFNQRTRRLNEDFKKKGITDHAILLLDYIFYGFNMEDDLLGGFEEEKIALRHAISLAMDWDERNESFYNGFNIVYDGPIPPGLQGHPEGHTVPNNFRGPDIERAKELLAKAGYPNGEGLPAIEYYTSKAANSAQQADMLERQLARVGIKINKNLLDFSELSDRVHNKNAPFFSFAWSSDYPDGENNLALFYGPNESPGSNHWNYKRAEFDEMYEKIRTMPPNEERGEMYEKMRDMVIQDAPTAGGMARTRFYLCNPRLKNFKPSEDFYNWVKYLNVEDN